MSAPAQRGKEAGVAGEAFDLERFRSAQAPVYETALAELRNGRKRSHWMWFVFPQLRGLGLSATAHHYGIVSLDEARAYLRDAVLGPRLETCTRAVLAHRGTSIRTIFGSPDDLKFVSSMTLFSEAAGGGPYGEAMAAVCEGRPDGRTLDLLAAARATRSGG